MGSDARRNVILTAAIAGLGGLLFGYDTGIIASAMLFIRTDLDLSSFQQGVVVAAVPIGAAFGALRAGPLADKRGRRIVIISSAFVFIAGSIVSAVAGSYEVLTLARIVIGVAIGFASATAPVYISEVAPPELRGRLVTLFQLAVTIGILVAYLVGLAFEPSRRLALDARPRRAPGAAAGGRHVPDAAEPALAGDDRGRLRRPRDPAPDPLRRRARDRDRDRGDRSAADEREAEQLERPAHADDEGGADRRHRARDPAAGDRHQHGHLLRADDRRVHRHRLLLLRDPRLDRRRHRQRPA